MSEGHGSAAPGWYPDPELQHTSRYWDGSAWTDHRAPAGPTPPDAEPGEPKRANRQMPLWVRIGLAGVAVLLLSWMWGPLGSDSSAMAESNCAALADEAVRISSEESGGFQSQLLKVRNPRVVEDNRETYSLPKGNGESLILACEGVGVWDSGANSRVRIESSVDADGDGWVSYEEVG